MNTRRNTLLIIADQFRWDCLGAAGNTVIRTPNLDALAREGTLFRKCFAQTAPCGPSRMCIYTSRYLCSTRSVNNYTPLADAHENVVMHIKDAGYQTAILGYNDYAVDPRILPEGDARRTSLNYENFLPGFETGLQHEYHSPEYFDYLRAKGYPEEWCGPEICSTYNVPPDGPGPHLPLRFPAHYRAEDSETSFLAGRATDYIRQRAGEGWFLSLNFIKPHPPRICPEPYHAMYDPGTMPSPARCPDELASTHPYLKLIHACPALEEESELRETMACYYGMISEVDACVGKVLDTLRATGQWENTLVVFMSDHGEYLGDHYLLDKGHFYDGAMRVPLIVRDPSQQADSMRGRVLDGFCESIDVAPTILDYLGIPVPDRFQGKSLLGVVRAEDGAQLKPRVHFEFDFRGRMPRLRDGEEDACLMWVVRNERFKYVQFGLDEMPPLLFDLENDPSELVNVAGLPEYAHAELEYCGHLIRWRMKHEDQRMERWASQFR
ncbi:MAG: sulfatase-like hydrolase/transferase [Candidatus Hydrogenedentes bacterium]|nr:sulfatase-like hydrolase/transferase [Candidatus Hydrogenedentota bacterium]